MRYDLSFLRCVLLYLLLDSEVSYIERREKVTVVRQKVLLACSQRHSAFCSLKVTSCQLLKVCCTMLSAQCTFLLTSERIILGSESSETTFHLPMIFRASSSGVWRRSSELLSSEP